MQNTISTALTSLASRFKVDPEEFESIVKKIAMPSRQTVSNEEFGGFLMVAKEYNLNPLTKEIYAFPAKGGGVVPIVSIDGWLRIINERPELDGIEFVDKIHDGRVMAITCKIYRKDRDKPVEVTEYLDECRGSSEPWKKWPMRMLRHKALIQCARYAFGFSGIVDPDEGERIISGEKDITPADSSHVSKEAERVAQLLAQDKTSAKEAVVELSEIEAAVNAIESSSEKESLTEICKQLRVEVKQDSRVKEAYHRQVEKLIGG